MHTSLSVNACGILVESVQRVGLALADVSVKDGLILIGHREVQGNHTVTAVHRGEGVVIGACRVQNATVEVVGSRLADGLVNGAAVNWVHRQGQGRGAVTAIDILALMHQRARAGRCEEGVKAITHITALGANLSAVLDIIAVVDRQVQGDDTVATIHGLELLHVCATLGIGFIIPGVTVTSSGLDRLGHRIMDGQVQGNSAVAAIDRLEMLHVIA